MGLEKRFKFSESIVVIMVAAIVIAPAPIIMMMTVVVVIGEGVSHDTRCCRACDGDARINGLLRTAVSVVGRRARTKRPDGEQRGGGFQD